MPRTRVPARRRLALALVAVAARSAFARFSFTAWQPQPGFHAIPNPAGDTLHEDSPALLELSFPIFGTQSAVNDHAAVYSTATGNVYWRPIGLASMGAPTLLLDSSNDKFVPLAACGDFVAAADGALKIFWWNATSSAFEAHQTIGAPALNFFGRVDREVHMECESTRMRIIANTGGALFRATASDPAGDLTTYRSRVHVYERNPGTGLWAHTATLGGDLETTPMPGLPDTYYTAFQALSDPPLARLSLDGDYIVSLAGAGGGLIHIYGFDSNAGTWGLEQTFGGCTQSHRSNRAFVVVQRATLYSFPILSTVCAAKGPASNSPPSVTFFTKQTVANACGGGSVDSWVSEEFSHPFASVTARDSAFVALAPGLAFVRQSSSSSRAQPILFAVGDAGQTVNTLRAAGTVSLYELSRATSGPSALSTKLVQSFSAPNPAETALFGGAVLRIARYLASDPREDSYAQLLIGVPTLRNPSLMLASVTLTTTRELQVPGSCCAGTATQLNANLGSSLAAHGEWLAVAAETHVYMYAEAGTPDVDYVGGSSDTNAKFHSRVFQGPGAWPGFNGAVRRRTRTGADGDVASGEAVIGLGSDLRVGEEEGEGKEETEAGSVVVPDGADEDNAPAASSLTAAEHFAWRMIRGARSGRSAHPDRSLEAKDELPVLPPDLRASLAVSLGLRDEPDAAFTARVLEFVEQKWAAEEASRTRRTRRAAAVVNAARFRGNTLVAWASSSVLSYADSIPRLIVVAPTAVDGTGAASEFQLKVIKPRPLTPTTPWDFATADPASVTFEEEVSYTFPAGFHLCAAESAAPSSRALRCARHLESLVQVPGCGSQSPLGEVFFVANMAQKQVHGVCFHVSSGAPELTPFGTFPIASTTAGSNLAGHIVRTGEVGYFKAMFASTDQESVHIRLWMPDGSVADVGTFSGPCSGDLDAALITGSVFLCANPTSRSVEVVLFEYSFDTATFTTRRQTSIPSPDALSTDNSNEFFGMTFIWRNGLLDNNLLLGILTPYARITDDYRRDTTVSFFRRTYNMASVEFEFLDLINVQRDWLESGIGANEFQMYTGAAAVVRTVASGASEQPAGDLARLFVQTASGVLQADRVLLVVDPVAGNDFNSGRAGSPLQSIIKTMQASCEANAMLCNPVYVSSTPANPFYVPRSLGWDALNLDLRGSGMDQSLFILDPTDPSRQPFSLRYARLRDMTVRGVFQPASLGTERAQTVTDLGSDGLEGGGVVQVLNGRVVVERVRLEMGSSSTSGGLAYLSSSTVTGTDLVMYGGAAQGGGCLYLTGSTFTCTGCSFTACDATLTHGGAVSLNEGSTLTLTNSVVRLSTSQYMGGAIFAGTNSYFFISLSEIVQCSSVAGGGAVASQFSYGEVSNSYLGGNSVSGGSGGAVFATLTTTGKFVQVVDSVLVLNSASSGGGAIAVENKGKVATTRGTFLLNEASVLGGGAVYASGDSTILSDSSSYYAWNYAPSGGALFLTSRVQASVSDATATLNVASNAGGALFCDSSATATLVGGRFSNNSATTTGGALHSLTCSVTATGTSFVGNGNTDSTEFSSAFETLEEKASLAAFLMPTTRGAVASTTDSFFGEPLFAERDASVPTSHAGFGRPYTATGPLDYLIPSVGTDIRASADADSSGSGGAAYVGTTYAAFYGGAPARPLARFTDCAFESNSASLGGALFAAGVVDHPMCVSRAAECASATQFPRYLELTGAATTFALNDAEAGPDVYWRQHQFPGVHIMLAPGTTDADGVVVVESYGAPVRAARGLEQAALPHSFRRAHGELRAASATKNETARRASTTSSTRFPVASHPQSLRFPTGAGVLANVEPGGSIAEAQVAVGDVVADSVYVKLVDYYGYTSALSASGQRPSLSMTAPVSGTLLEGFTTAVMSTAGEAAFPSVRLLAPVGALATIRISMSPSLGVANAETTVQLATECSGLFGLDASGKRCVACAESQVTDGLACQSCAPGFIPTYPAAQPRGVCVACPRGSRYRNGACESCTAGTHQNFTAQQSCETCPAGKYSGAKDAFLCDDCPSGLAPAVNRDACEACVGDTIGVPGQLNCITCGPGQVPDRTHGACVPCGFDEYEDAADPGTCAECPTNRIAEQGSTSCRSCPAGMEPDLTSTGRRACVACEIGYYESDGACQQCPAGSFSNATQQATCWECEPGFFVATPGNRKCEPCSLTAIAPRAGAETCDACAADQVAIEGIRCDYCPAGRYASTVASSTESCPRCARGSVSEARSTECTSCPAGTIANSLFTECVACPSVGTSCNGVTMTVQNGYWWESMMVQVNYTDDNQPVAYLAADTYMHACLTEEACTVNITVDGFLVSEGVVCTEGHEGPMCATCKSGYSLLTSGACSECWPPIVNVLIIIVSVAIASAVAGFFVMRTQRNAKKNVVSGNVQAGMVRITLNYLKINIALGEFRAKAPALIQSIRGGTDAVASGMSFSLPPIQCAFDFTYAGQFLGYLLLPVIIAAASGCVVFLSWWRATGCGRRNAVADSGRPMEADEVQRSKEEVRAEYMTRWTSAVVILLFFVYHNIVKATFTVWDVYTPAINGTYYLRADFRISSDSSEFTWLIVGSVVSMVVYVIGVPAAAMILLYRNRNNLLDPKVVGAYGFLFAGYEIGAKAEAKKLFAEKKANARVLGKANARRASIQEVQEGVLSELARAGLLVSPNGSAPLMMTPGNGLLNGDASPVPMLPPDVEVRLQAMREKGSEAAASGGAGEEGGEEMEDDPLALTSQRYWYWESIVLARLVGVMVISVFIEDPFLQSFIGAWLVIAALVLHLLAKPYEDSILDIMEGLGLLSTLVTQLGSILWYQYPDNDTETAVTVVLILVNVFTLITFGLATFLAFFPQRLLRCVPCCGELLVKIYHRKRDWKQQLIQRTVLAQQAACGTGVVVGSPGGTVPPASAADGASPVVSATSSGALLVQVNSATAAGAANLASPSGDWSGGVDGRAGRAGAGV